MCLRGVSFQIHGNDFIEHICKLMNVLDYDWYIDDMMANFADFRDGFYSGAEALEFFNHPDQLMFARIRRYPRGSIIGEIDTYAEYVNSECDLFILFYDNGYYQVYAKQIELIRAMYELCASERYINAEYITDTNDGRTRMSY